MMSLPNNAALAPAGRRPLKVALLQMTATKSLDKNFTFLEEHITKAAKGGASYIQTPENSLIMDLDSQHVAKVAMSAAYEEALSALKALAARLQVCLHLGASAVALPPSGEGGNQAPRLANRSFLFTAEGHVGGTYDKIHMFDVSLPGGEVYRESQNYQPGDKAVVVDCGFARLGLTICYDLRFPALYRQLAQAGAEMISVPAAFTRVTGEAHWHILLRARAIETGCFILASAQTGVHETGRSTFGHSLIVTPWGEVVGDAGVECGLLEAEIDLTDVYDVRAKIPSLGHDRPFEMDAPL